MDAKPRPEVEAFFDPATNTVTYLVIDPATSTAAIVDSVLDFDPKSGRTSTASADALLARIRERGLKVEWHLETHVHADHFSAAQYLRSQLGGRIAIGAQITVVQETFGKLFNVGAEFARDGRQFDHRFTDGERFRIGTLEATVLHTPGHTPACVTYVVGNAAFVGDTLFMPDYGTARADFPGGDARQLFRSIQRVLALPPDTRLFLCHDYPPASRAVRWETSVRDERALNIHVREGTTEDAFVAMREARDATLSMPALLLPSVQVNMRAGELPPPEANGVRYLKLPLNAV
jgi:glyoxylase-like metal-dependent hydrolase (beta-lactamase superfamily II)